jgi:hypothetical protein
MRESMRKTCPNNVRDQNGENYVTLVGHIFTVDALHTRHMERKAIWWHIFWSRAVKCLRQWLCGVTRSIAISISQRPSVQFDVCIFQ